MSSSGLTEKDQLALKRFKEAITKALGNELVEPTLFGSKARGDAKEDYKRLYEKGYPFVKNVIRDGIMI
jgi:hypothetical protein